MIFGGLEIVAGGYFAHKYYKNKSEKRRLEEEAQHRRNNTFPSNRPSSNRTPSYPLQPHFQHQEQRPQQTAPQQKYACYAQGNEREVQGARQQLRPKPSHAQSFTIPRRPVPQRKPEIVIQPGLQRADSMATLSRMPVANGYRPSNQANQANHTMLQNQTSLQRADSMATLSRMPIANGYRPSDQAGLNPPHQSPYGNAGFAVSSPAFSGNDTSPVALHGNGHSVDDNWETYGHGAQRYTAYAPTEASTQLGERDPPPPYAP